MTSPSISEAPPTKTPTNRSRLPSGVPLAAVVAFLATTADNFVLFLLLWLAQPQGWSGVQTAVVVLVLRLPTLLSGVLLGAAVDRWGARPLLLLDLTTRSVLLAAMAIAGRSGHLPVPAVLVFGGICGALSPATYTAVRWLLPRIVDPDRMVRANAIVAVSDQLPLLVGASLVGPVLTRFDTGGALLLPAGMLTLATVLAARLPRPRSRRAPSGTPPAPTVRGDALGAESVSGWPPRVIALIALSTAYYFVYGPFETASPPFVRSHLHGGAGTYSLLWALFGVGALTTVTLAPRLSGWRPGIVNAFGALLWGAVMLPVAIVNGVPLAVALFLIGGAVWGPYTAVEVGALQQWVDPSRHGRVFGIQRSLLATATPLGAAAGAMALEVTAPGTVLALSAAACSVAGLFALTNRDLRRAR
jgi:predicted MFS family arabinose efflux permease